jgi:adenosylmethionine-8-amino-7-oxononanoate aminotransferase
MMALELVKNPLTKEGFAPEVEIAKRVYQHCKDRGLMMRPIGPLCVFSPPLTFDKAAIDKMVDIVDQSLHATLDDLTQLGIL